MPQKQHSSIPLRYLDVSIGIKSYQIKQQNGQPQSKME